MAGTIEPLSPPQPAKSQVTELAPRAISAAVIGEILAIVLLVALADVTIYRGAGFAGLALLFVAAPSLLALGSPVRRMGLSFWIVAGMLGLLGARLLWLGSPLAVLVGAGLLVASALALHGLRPYVVDVAAGVAQLFVAGGVGIQKYLRAATGVSPQWSVRTCLGVLLPVAALVLFGTLFVLANPDLVTAVVNGVERIARHIADWLEGLSNNAWEIAFWLAAAYVVIGLLRPLLRRNVLPDVRPAAGGDVLVAFHEAPLYGPIRNTLCAVIGLFAVYLVFEFATLWFREFPPGFHYSGYAHEGAFWLTVALALATLVLSLMFRSHVLRDPRLGRLRVLAWIWSAQNLLLAVTVYHRMYIYIDFNGMTRMRVIGLLGITTVVAGFVLVLWKIVHNRDFAWLIHRQLWALSAAVYLFALLPVDMLVHRYNVRQILSGDVAPSVQISVHPISAEGYLVLAPLLRCDDPIVRDGVRAMLAERELQAEQAAAERDHFGWTAWQVSEEVLLRQLRTCHGDWQDLSDEARRHDAIARFRSYAYQWY